MLCFSLAAIMTSDRPAEKAEQGLGRFGIERRGLQIDRNHDVGAHGLDDIHGQVIDQAAIDVDLTILGL